MLNFLAAEENVHKFKQQQSQGEQQPPQFLSVLRSQFSEAPQVDRAVIRSAHLSWYNTNPQGGAGVHRGSEGGWTSAALARPQDFAPPPQVLGGVDPSARPSATSQYLFDEQCERRRVANDNGGNHTSPQQHYYNTGGSLAPAPPPAMAWLRKATVDYDPSAPPQPQHFSERLGRDGGEHVDETLRWLESKELAHDAYRSAIITEEDPQRARGTAGAFTSATERLERDVSAVIGVYDYRAIDIREQRAARTARDAPLFGAGLLDHLAHSRRLDDSADSAPPRSSWISRQTTPRPGKANDGGGQGSPPQGATLFDFPTDLSRVAAVDGTLTSTVMDVSEPHMYPSVHEALRTASVERASQSTHLQQDGSHYQRYADVGRSHREEGVPDGKAFSPFMTRSASKRVFAR